MTYIFNHTQDLWSSILLHYLIQFLKSECIKSCLLICRTANTALNLLNNDLLHNYSNLLTVKHFIETYATVLSHLHWATHFCERCDSSLNEVVRVRRAFTLSKHVGDTNAFEHGTHSTTGLNTSTRSSRLEDYARTTELSNLFVRNSTLVNRHFDKILLSSLYALSDGCGNFVSLTKAKTDDAVIVTYNDNCSECECTTTLSHLSGAVDCNKAILQFNIVSRFNSVIFIYHDFLKFKSAFASAFS